MMLWIVLIVSGLLILMVGLFMIGYDCGYDKGYPNGYLEGIIRGSKSGELGVQKKHDKT